MKGRRMVRKKNCLKEYKKKQRFDKTPEPKDAKSKKHNNTPIFVIQKHNSRQLHYDFRLEDNGILKSWALPKGPTIDPEERHLAVQTEDHPLDYANFEGKIPEGEYGTGDVIIWDKGTYKNLKENNDLMKNIKNGEIAVWLEGKKLKGGFALIQTKYQSNKKNWLLIKMKDEYAKPNKTISKQKK
jgi:bifunctional non-homologous end joining protein LigD